MLTFQGRLSGLFGYVARHSEDKHYVFDFFRFINMENRISLLENPKPLSTKTPEIIFENVSFTYPGCEKPTISNVNLTIAPGEKLAIV